MSENEKARRSRGRPEPAPVEVREMKLNDLPVVFALGQELFTADKLPTLYRSWDEHEVVTLFGTDDETCLVAEARGEIIGFALGRIMEKPRNAWRYGWVEWLGVRPGWKRSGIASRLLGRLTELFLEREARMMLVDTDEENTDALAFFEKHGFGHSLRHVYLSCNLDDHPRPRHRRSSAR